MLQDGSIQLNVAKQFNVHQQTVFRNGRPRSTAQRQDHPLVTNALRHRTQNATRLQQQFFNATVVRVTTQTARNRLHVAQLHPRRPNIVLPLNVNHRQARRVWCRLGQRWAQWCNITFSDESSFVSDFPDGRQRAWSRAGGALPASSHDRIRPLRRWKCHGLGRDHHDWEDRTPHLSGECHRALLQETTSLGLMLRPTPIGMGMHSSFKTTTQEPIVHVLSKITCSFSVSRLSHGQRSPQTCLQLNVCGTSSGDESGHGLTSHRT